MPSDKPKKQYTSEDVARLAGVSQSTVSRVFAGNIQVSEKRRKKILEIANQLNYQPNAHARSLITKKSKLIGIIMKRIRNPFYSAVLEIFHARFSALGYNLIFINSDNEEITESEISKLLEYNVAGVIVSDALLSHEAEARFKRLGIAIVLFNRYVKQADYSAVFCDNYLAAKQIARYLVETGHRSFAFISGPKDTSITTDRLKGFQEVLKDKHIAEFQVETGQYSYESGFQATQELLTRDKTIDCIFGGNDIIALGAIDAIRLIGMKVPDDISVVGFDNILMTGWFSYRLTTWEQPLEDMVDATVSILIDDITNRSRRPQTLMMKGHLVIRNTVRVRA